MQVPVFGKLDSTGKALIAANSINIVLAIVLGFDFALIIWLYWFESIIVGGYTILALLYNGIRSGLKGIKLQVILAAFFAVHYGLFHLGYLVFLWAIPLFAIREIEMNGLLITAGVFLISHGYSFFRHMSEAPFSPEKGSQMFIQPYKRIIPMHLTIIASGFMMIIPAEEFAKMLLMIVFMALKTAGDLFAHQNKHRLR